MVLFSLPETLWADLGEIVGGVFSDLLPLIVIIIAVFLGFFVVERIIRAIRE